MTVGKDYKKLKFPFVETIPSFDSESVFLIGKN